LRTDLAAIAFRARDAVAAILNGRHPLLECHDA
jgi:hypothetical protein